MTKEFFIESVEKLDAQFRHDQKCLDAFSVILNDSYISGYDNSIVTEQFLKILKEAVNDKNGWIEYYVYELEFGRGYRDGCVTINGENVSLKTATDLWDIIST